MLRSAKLIKILLIAAFLLVALITCSAQTRVYQGNSRMNSDVICTIDGEKIYNQTRSMSSDVVCTINENQVYARNSKMQSDVLISFNGDLAYYKRSRMTHDVLYSRHGNQIRKHNGYSYVVVATIRNNKIYEGISNMESSVLFRFDGEYTYQQLITILYLLENQ